MSGRLTDRCVQVEPTPMHCGHCILVSLVLAIGAPLVALADDQAVLSKELNQLLETRRNAIQSVAIKAEKVSQVRGSIRPQTPQQVREILNRYVASGRTAMDRVELYRAFHEPPLPDGIAESVQY